jgi:hypothetical protein
VQLSCTFSPPARLVAFNEDATELEVPARLQLLWNGRPARNLFWAQALVANTGNLPITQDRMRIPVTFELTPGAEFLESTITATYPDCLKVRFQPDSERNEAMLDFVLLNPGHRAYLALVWSGQAELPKVQALIEGMREIRVTQWESTRWVSARARRWALIVTGTLSGIAMGNIVGISTDALGRLDAAIVISLLVIVAALVVPVAFVFRDMHARSF